MHFLLELQLQLTSRREQQKAIGDLSLECSRGGLVTARVRAGARTDRRSPQTHSHGVERICDRIALYVYEW